MVSVLQGEHILLHLERFLGVSKKRWLCPGDESPFQVLLFPECPDSSSQCLVTYGLSAHQLRIMGKNDSVIQVELIICADSLFDPKVLAASLIAVGLDAIRKNAIPTVHEVLLGEGAVSSNPVFEHLYLTFPGFFSPEFELCETVSPPVAIVQLIPISTNEKKLIAKRGWRVFEEGLAKQDIDLFKFDQRKELAF
ncbi:suppressor of fused domain protein [Methylicorpusculum sp.]|uniref:suppressor of fused domain protein n=1 Tax=Methylicorpusculum sp. TaxID=2713644 RepID=UPI002AB89D77|nr:suppressor of fused domain protein [Methylicorpusculum sp.]MDZ4151301.1 suppressor of fused domain protein [Methylicorpusculum sp.]